LPPGDLNRLLQDYAARIEKNTKRLDRLETLEFSSAAFPSGGIACFETVKLAAPATSVTLPTVGVLPATFWHLWLLISAKAEPDTIAGFQPLLRFNGDAGSNYRSYKNIWTRDQTDTDSQTSVGSATATANGIDLMTVGGAQSPGEDNTSRNGCEVNIYDYAATDFFKTVSWKGWRWSSIDQDTGGATIEKGLGGGIWRSLAAITSVTVARPGGISFDTGSVFTLIGVCTK